MFVAVVVDEQAEVGVAVFNELQAGIAAGKEDEFDVAAEYVGLLRREAEVLLEGDEVRLAAGRARMCAEIVFAGGEEDGGSLEGLAAGKRGLPMVIRAGEGFDAVAAADVCTGLLREREQGLVETVAGERERGEEELRFGDDGAGGEADGVDGDGSERGEIEAEGGEVVQGFVGEEFAADFVVRSTVEARSRWPTISKSSPGA